MKKEINNLEKLNEVIELQLEKLNTLELGSEEHKKATEALSQLYKLKIEEESTTVELGTKIKQYGKENKQAILKMGIDVAGIVLPLAFYATWMNKGFKFEETGSFTSTTFRGLFQKFKTTR